MLKYYLIIFIFFTQIVSNAFAKDDLASSVTPSHVFAYTEQLHKEIKLLKKHFNIKKKPVFKDIKTKLLPRHAWQRTYELFVKINILREKNNLPVIEPINMEPTLALNPIYTYEQIQRLIQEIRILKFHLGIKERVSPYKLASGKSPIDVYNHLNEISRELDLINGAEFTPSYVFAESLRIFEDMDAILTKLGINAITGSPAKIKGASPKDSYDLAIKLLNFLRTLEIQAGLQTVDFYAFERKNVNPGDVFEITQIILSELQVIKAHIGLNHHMTRGALKYTAKKPEDVAQIMGWLIRKARLINSLNKGLSNEF